jgi:hypothetical protein
MRRAAFVISLDFELIWGVRDKRTIAKYGANILGVRQAIPAMLDLFAERGITATWATVGFLFFENKDELIAALPGTRPHYTDARLSPYGDIAGIGSDERDDPYHFGRSLLDRIRDYPDQEIGTHTFSHFYCLEEGGDIASFGADLAAAKAAAARLGITLASIVFPRNQISVPHLRVCREHGMRAFRGNESAWFHRSCRDADQTFLMRAARFADSYLPLGGGHDREPQVVEGIVDIPSSRFLRPVGSGGGEGLRLQRITGAMEQAALRGTVFHLWWHPHNFGVNLPANLAFLRAILDSFQVLQQRHGMRSMTMAALADEVLGVG